MPRQPDARVDNYEPFHFPPAPRTRPNFGLGGGPGGGGGGGGFGGGNENVRGRIGQIKGGVMASTSRPTEVQMRQLKETQTALPKLVSDANAAIAKVPALARELLGSNVLFPAIKPITQ